MTVQQAIVFMRRCAAQREAEAEGATRAIALRLLAEAHALRIVAHEIAVEAAKGGQQ